MSANASYIAARSDQHRARNLLHTLSWRVEKVFRQRGDLGGYLWVTEDSDNRRTWFETECEADPREMGDNEVLAALRAELLADFMRDGVVRYAVAFPAYATTVLRQSILHLAGEKVRHSVICLEAHASAVHLRSQREIHGSSLAALAAVEPASGCFADLC